MSPSATHKSIGLQAVALAASSGVAQVLVAFLYILAARSAEPANFGLVVSSLAIATTAVGFIDFGTNSLWVREIASNRMDVGLLGTRMASKLLFAFAILTAWTAITSTFFGSSFLWMAGPVAMSVLISQTFHVPLRGLGRGELVAMAILGDKLVAASSFAIFMAIGLGPLSALWMSLSIGSLSSGWIAWRLTPRERRGRLKLQKSTNPWAASGHYGIANVAISAQSLDIPALTLVGGPGAAGIYAAVNRWTQPMGLLASAFASAAAPHVARARSSREAWVEARKSSWLLIGAIMMCLVVAIFASQIVDVLLGSKYTDSSDVLRLLALAAMLSVANQPLFVFLQSRGFDKAASLVTVSCILLQLILVVALSSSMHALGAALASVCAQFFMFLALVVVLARKNGKRTKPPMPTAKLADSR
jgi:O-antigen/teichoic acid export membrane protein